MLGGAKRSTRLGVPPFEVLHQLALGGEAPLDILEIFRIGDELRLRVH